MNKLDEVYERAAKVLSVEQFCDFVDAMQDVRGDDDLKSAVAERALTKLTTPKPLWKRLKIRW